MARLAFDDVRTNCAEKNGVFKRACEATKDAFQRFGKKTTAILVDGVFLTVFGIGIAACGDTNQHYNTCPDATSQSPQDTKQKEGYADVASPEMHTKDNSVLTEVAGPEINNGDNTGHDRQVFYDVAPPEITLDIQYVDVLPEGTMDVAADIADTQPDTVQPPPQFFSYSFTSLIGDFLDRTLEDRGTQPSEYPTGTDDLADTANPFTDGNGGFLIGAPDTVALYRISGTEFEPLATADVVDDFQALWYKETQNIWVSGSVYYSQAEHDMLAEFGTVAYTLKFDGPGSKNFGIPVCAKILAGTDYTQCDYGNQTVGHKIQIKLFGENWFITEIIAPDQELTNEAQLVNGGSVAFGKEISSGILNVNEFLVVGEYMLKLEDVLFLDNKPKAKIGIYNLDGGNPMPDNIVLLGSGDDLGVMVNGYTFTIRCWKTANGGSDETTWADLSALTAVGVNDGIQYIYGNTVHLAWKNRGASAADTTPDHLRAIIFSPEDTSKISSTGSEKLKAGDYLGMPTLFTLPAWKLTFDGIDLKPEDYDTLKFQVGKAGDSPLTLKGINGDPSVQCTLIPPYMKITSGMTDAFEGYGNEVFLAVSGVDEFCSSAPHPVFGKNKGEENGYTMTTSFSEQDAMGMSMSYAAIEGVDGTPGHLLIENLLMGPSQFVFSIDESAGTWPCLGAYNTMQFAFDTNGSATFGWESGTIVQYYPTDANGSAFVSVYTPGAKEPGFVSERGSVYQNASPYEVVFKTAKKLGKAKFTIKTSEGEANE